MNSLTESPMRAVDVRAQVNLIQEVMRDVMQKDIHFGTVPGCGDKPTLLQPGAHKLLMTFRLVPEPEMDVIPMGLGHREVRCKVKISSQGGVLLGVGVGTCSTMEGKYRYRTGPVDYTETPVPKEYWTLRDTDPKKAKALLGEGMVAKKNEEGRWVLARQGANVEHDNPADYYNTVEKMAYKRALVSATLTVTAASDIFTQDIEDMPEVIPQPAQQAAPQTAPQAEEAQLADVQQKLKATQAPQQPDVIALEDWHDIVLMVEEQPELSQAMHDWQDKHKVKNLGKLNAVGQQALLTHLREQAKQLGVTIKL